MDALTHIARGVLDVRPLVDRLEHPVRVVHGSAQHPEPLEAFLNRVAARVGAPAFTTSSDVRSVFELAVSRRLFGETLDGAVDVTVDADAEEQLIEDAISASFDRTCFRAVVESFDGALLRVYNAGDARNTPVFLVSPCGMPAKLCESWIHLLARDCFVITWETRLLFDDPVNVDALAFDVNAQVADLFAVMDHFGIGAAHLMGLCGGAVIALSAAAARPERVSSLSLWHGDFELGPGCPKTKHQKDLKAFMQAAAMARPQAEQIHKLFSQNTLKNFRSDWAHVVLYPYANAELLYRYARCNGNIMATSVMPLVAKVAQPTLVVTSRDDSTTHPEGSKRVAELLPCATLEVVPHGDHLSLFNAEPDVTDLAVRFIATEECHA